VQEFERKRLLERIERDGATVGVTIPDEITIQGETIDLQSFVFEIQRRETIPRGERDRVEQAKRNLRRERLERTEKLEDGEVSYEEGERIATATIGIDRALNALEQLGTVDLEQESKTQEMADKKRWMQFLRKALGHTDSGTGRAGRGK